MTGNKCTHTVIVNGHWEDSPFYNPGEDQPEDRSNWVDGYDKPTTVDIDIHTYKCTQCGKEFRY